MTTFNQDYYSILEWAKVKFMMTDLLIDEIINEAYVVMHGECAPYSFDMFKKIAVSVSYKMNKKDAITYNENGNYRDFNEKGECRMCKGCLEVYPVQMFNKKYMTPTGLVYYDTRCKTCESSHRKKIDAIRQKKILDRMIAADSYSPITESYTYQYKIKQKEKNPKGIGSLSYLKNNKDRWKNITYESHPLEYLLQQGYSGKWAIHKIKVETGQIPPDKFYNLIISAA